MISLKSLLKDGDGNIVVNELKIDRSGISSCITGKQKQSGNYIWK